MVEKWEEGKVREVEGFAVGSEGGRKFEGGGGGRKGWDSAAQQQPLRISLQRVCKMKFSKDGVARCPTRSLILK